MSDELNTEMSLYQPGQPGANQHRAARYLPEWFTATFDRDPPEELHIVGLGQSLESWYRYTMERNPAIDPGAEVWTVNRGLTAVAHDLLFVMDDLVGEAELFPKYGDLLRSYERPFITSTPYAGFSGLAYPLVSVSCFWGGMNVAGYLHNSIPYLLALAGGIGVKRVVLWGCDYAKPDGTMLEYGLANVEYWCGLLRGRGVTVGRPQTSTILGGQREQDWIYGYRLNRLPGSLREALSALETPAAPPAEPKSGKEAEHAFLHPATTPAGPSESP